MMIVYCTSPRENAEEMARVLVRERLVACAGIIPQLHSVYWWKGKIEEAEESLLVMKTRRDLVKDLMSRIRSLHPYEVPEIVSVRIEDAFEPYAAWVRAETKQPARESGPRGKKTVGKSRPGKTSGRAG